MDDKNSGDCGNNHIQVVGKPQQQKINVSLNQEHEQQQQTSHTIIQLSRSDSHTSSNSELEKDLLDLELTGSGCNSNSNNSIGGSSAASVGVENENGLIGGKGSNNDQHQPLLIQGNNKIINNKKVPIPQKEQRLSSSRTLTKKAKRVRFYKNGDKFHSGFIIPVSNERYRSFDSLAEDLTRLLEDNVKLTGAIRTIYTVDGKKIVSLDDLEDGKSYVCSCKNEQFKKLDYNTIQQVTTINKNTNRLSKVIRPLSPLKNNFFNNGLITSVNTMTSSSSTTQSTNINKTTIINIISERDSVVHPKIVTLIRNGTKPRKIMRLLLNKRNSPSFDHVLTAITQCVKLDTGCVRKVFSLSGTPVLTLADFFSNEDVFFAYGNERVGNDDFDLETDEIKTIRNTRKTLRNGTTRSGPKPKMPVKSHHNITYDCEDVSLDANSVDLENLPIEIHNKYSLGPIIGVGNFAVVLKVKDKVKPIDYALKIIDKTKCKGKEHYIDAEVRVMKKLDHRHILQLYETLDTKSNMYLVLELVNGGDLFDAITRVQRFSESQSRIMIKHLASAMSYLHSLCIVHRDIKPENLLVELDENGMVTMLKLGDFGLACEVTEPLLAVCGTPTYVAPEILIETGYGLKIDVWAAGIILYILLCGFPPFVSPMNQQEPLFDAILSGVYEFPEPYWTDIGDGVRDLIANMLQSDPDLRFSSEDILDHFWVMGLTCDSDDSIVVVPAIETTSDDDCSIEFR